MYKITPSFHLVHKMHESKKESSAKEQSSQSRRRPAQACGLCEVQYARLVWPDLACCSPTGIICSYYINIPHLTRQPASQEFSGSLMDCGLSSVSTDSSVRPLTKQKKHFTLIILFILKSVFKVLNKILKQKLRWDSEGKLDKHCKIFGLTHINISA